MASGKLPEGFLAIASGEVTIQSDATEIDVTTNLGYNPDFAMIYVKNPDFTLIPYGACVYCVFGKDIYTNAPNYSNFHYQYWYRYKHTTSGNLLQGAAVAYINNNVTENTFRFARGNDPWRAQDVNGNPIVYKWVAIKMSE